MKSDRRGGGRRYEWVERGVEREDLGGRKKNVVRGKVVEKGKR